MSETEHTTTVQELPKYKPLQQMRRSPSMHKQGQGPRIVPRSDLNPGVVTRREWLRFLHFLVDGPVCSCTDISHRHWLWRPAIAKDKYGKFTWRGRKYAAHRFAYIALGRSIPDGYEPDHLCRIHACCNPACLEVVPTAINILRGEGPPARNARKTHCPEGHLLAGANLRPVRRGNIRGGCCICNLAKTNAAYARKKQARGLT